jgi:hypothetical protein
MTNRRYGDLGMGVKRAVDCTHRHVILLDMKQSDPILLDVFRAYGTQTAIAKELGVTRQAISKWRHVPLKYVRRVSQFTGLSPAVLRPDIYADL